MGVILTDGHSTSITRARRSAEAVHAAGISIYSFGVGRYGITQEELVTISGNKTSNVFIIDDFSLLDTNYNHLEYSHVQVS